MNTPAFEAAKTRSDGTSVEIFEVTKRFGQAVAVDAVSLHVKKGEFLSLVGPSGSGKTTLLSMIAGFEHPTSGQIKFGTRDVTDIPAYKRGIGMVFQKYALFPHMSALENVAFPLKMRGLSGDERLKRAERALATVKLGNLGKRLPSELSGGQQQRVALARALVFSPQMILMDEPLGALDKKLRQEMQLEIKELQREIGATVIFVTHDQEEALTMADRIAIMNNGKIEQIGTPDDLYNQPGSLFVADFLGSMNFITARILAMAGSHLELSVGQGQCAVARSNVRAEEQSLQLGDDVVVAVRPENIKVFAASSKAGSVGARVRQKVFNGATTSLFLDLDDGSERPLHAVVNSAGMTTHHQPGSQVSISWEETGAAIFRKP